MNSPDHLTETPWHGVGPFGTLRNVLWIGGGQWAGKSTVARLLAVHYGLTAYHYDYHDARGHDDRPIIAEGWGLRPDLVAPIIDAPDRMVVLVPTREFREHQLRTLPRAGTFGHQVSDPERGQRNRIARDRLVAEDAVRTAGAHGIRVIDVDGTRDAEAIAGLVAEHFAAYLPEVAHA